MMLNLNDYTWLKCNLLSEIWLSSAWN